MTTPSTITFEEFPVPSYEQWRKEAEATLDGAPFEKKLVTRTFEGIDLQPIYRKEDLAKLNHLGSAPGQPPYVRGAKTTNDWEISQDCACAPGIDPLHKLVGGKLDKSLEAAFGELAKADAIAVNTRLYHNAGANAVQELAFAMATAVEYLRQNEARGVSVEQSASKLTFGFSMGADFFMAIAKLRAARLLWSRIVAASGGGEAAQKLRVHASTSLWNKSKLDPYVNMLRNTTEAFAAVAGGCESLFVGPFDEVVRKPDEFSERIARNTQVILSKECHFDHVVDPAGGSYYVETLTAQVAEAAWAVFQQIEKQGGMLKALQAGVPQAQIKAVAAKKAEAIAQRRLSIVGTNVYANATEKPLEGADANWTPCGCGLGESMHPVETLSVKRGAEPFEQLRAAVGASDKKKVFLANMGPLRQHKARADFSTGFFQAGGFEVLENRGFQTVDEAAAAFAGSGALVTVICSTDDTYPEVVPALTQKLKAVNPKGLLVLAGFPKEHVEAFKAAGVDEFIHIRANCHDVLRGIATKLGIF